MRRLARNLCAFCRTLALGVIVLVGAVALALGLVGTVGDVQARLRFSSDPTAPLIVVAAEPWVLQLGTIRLDAKGSAWTQVHGPNIAFRANDWRFVSLRCMWFQQRQFGGISSDGTQQTFRSVWIPFWIPVVLAGIIVAAWFRRRVIPGRRAMAGLCPACGYDLRASPEQCPECGALARVIP